MGGPGPASHLVEASCLLAVAVLLVAAVPASAFTKSANVVITVDRSAYQVGDFVNVTVRVFNYAVPTDPLSIALSLNPGSLYGRNLTLSWQSVGVYRATFMIQSTDLGAPVPLVATTLRLEATAQVAGLTDVEDAYLAVVPAHTFRLAVSASSFDAAPGDTVSLALQVTLDGVPHDADGVAVTAMATSSNLSYESLLVSVANASTGSYLAALTVPGDLVPPGQIVVVSQATLSNATRTQTTYLAVPGSQPYDVWAYQSVFAPPTIQFTIFVGDAFGGFVSAADVNLSYAYYSSSAGGVSAPYGVNATTDVYGRAAFDLYLAGASGVLGVTYRGNVTKGATRQAISGLLFAPTSMSPFQIVRANGYAFFAANTTAELNYTTLSSGLPIAGVTVYYYAQNNVEFVAAGNATSDANGDFTLDLPVPPGGLNVLLTARSGSTWYSTTDRVDPYPPLAVEATPVRVGGAVQANLTFPASAEWYTSVTLAPYLAPGTTSPWLQVSGFFGTGSPYVNGSRASYNLSVPRFLPKDTDYLLSAYAMRASSIGVESGRTVYAYSRLIHIVNIPAQVRDDLSTSSAAVGDVVTANASSSYDPDGYIVAYRIDWGDGSYSDWSAAPTFAHAYASPGDYRVTVAVRDDSGAVSQTQTLIHVEGTILGIPASLAIPLFVGITGAAVAAVAVFLWRRRGSAARTPAPPAEEGPAVQPPKPPPGTV